MSYFGSTPGYRHKYIATDQPLYGLGGGIPGVNTSGWGTAGLGAVTSGANGAFCKPGSTLQENLISSCTYPSFGFEQIARAKVCGRRPSSLGNTSQTVDGLGSLGALGDEPTPGPTAAPAGFSMPSGLKSIWFDESGAPRPESQSYLAKFFGRMVDATGALYQGVICDNVSGGTAPGASVDASQAIDNWSKAGFFVIASQQAGVCDGAKGAYGKATWTVYRLPKERLAEIVGAPVFVVRLPFDKTPTAANWAEYAPYLMAPVGPDGKAGGAVPVQNAGISGNTIMWGVLIGAIGLWFFKHERFEIWPSAAEPVGY